MAKKIVDLKKCQMNMCAFISAVNNYLKSRKVMPKLRLLLDLLVKAATIYKALKN